MNQPTSLGEEGSSYQGARVHSNVLTPLSLAIDAARVTPLCSRPRLYTDSKYSKQLDVPFQGCCDSDRDSGLSHVIPCPNLQSRAASWARTDRANKEKRYLGKLDLVPQCPTPFLGLLNFSMFIHEGPLAPTIKENKAAITYQFALLQAYCPLMMTRRSSPWVGLK